MPEVVREAIDPKHRMRPRPFAVWVGGPEDGEPKDIDIDTLKIGHILIRTYERVGYLTELEKAQMGYLGDKRPTKPIEHIYPIREVFDRSGLRGWRIYYNEREKA